MKLILGAVLSLLFLSGVAVPQDSQDWRKEMSSGATLGTIRRLFLNHGVVISGNIVNLRGSVLLGWKMARKGRNERYLAASIVDNVPAAYNGQTATVVAVQLNDLVGRGDIRPNALGEIVSDNDSINPYFDLIVRFDNGKLAMCTAYPNTLSGQVDLASSANDLADEMSKQLPLLVGKSVYAVGYSHLYQTDTTLEEMVGVGVGVRGVLKQLPPAAVPLLEPLTVLAVRYVNSRSVVIKVKLPDGKEALSFTGPTYYQATGSEKPFLERAAGTLLLNIPKDLTETEIDAVRHGKLYKGMTRAALSFLLGFSQKENDWGRGGKQLIYNDRFFVYLDSSDAVEDWQSLSGK